MARLDFKLPDIGEGIAEAEIVEWHAAIGDAVKEGQVVAAVMTDKATVEMEAPGEGILIEKGGAAGDMVAVGATLFALETSAELPDVAGQGRSEHAKPEQASTPGSARGAAAKPAGVRQRKISHARVLASPAVRQRARTLGIDLAAVPARGDRVIHDDLDRYLLDHRAARSDERRTNLVGKAEAKNAQEIPIVGVRRQIARRMEEAKRRIPHFTYVEEVDVTVLEQIRQSLNAKRTGGAAFHLLPFLCLAICRALKEYPQLNAHFDDDRDVMTIFEEVHLGIATHTHQGLIVPVLRNAERMNLREITQSIADLAERGRSGKLGRNELQGSTFTISSLGKLGGIAATPIINRPEVAVLAPNRVVERIAMTAIGSAPRMAMNLSISCDHRVIDGFVAASFIQQIRRILEKRNYSDWLTG